MPTPDADPTHQPASDREHLADKSGDVGGEWVPAIGDEVLVYPGTDEQTTGQIVDDFGEFTAHRVEANDITIAAPARRWAILTAAGYLIFVDTEQLTRLVSPT